MINGIMQLQDSVEIKTAKDVYSLLKDEMKDLKQECFKIVLLDPRGKVIQPHWYKRLFGLLTIAQAQNKTAC